MLFQTHSNTPFIMFLLLTVPVGFVHAAMRFNFENCYILTAYAELPTPLRTPQTSGHSSFHVSNLPLWSLKSPQSHGSKIIIFYLSQSKCTVSALFLHGFKGCNGHSDLQNTTKGAEIAGQKITMLCAKMT